MQQKRLALICQHFYPEMLSTGLFMTNIATGLVQRGWNVRVYCAQPLYLPGGVNNEDTPRYLEYEGVEIVRVPTLSTARLSPLRRLINAATFLLAIAWYLLRDRKALLGVINTTNPPFLGLVAWLAKWLLGLPYLTIIHDVYPDVAVRLGMLGQRSPITWGWERLTRLIFNQSAGLVVIGRDMAGLVRSKLRRRTSVPMTLIPHWADLTTVYPVPKAENAFVQQHQLADRFVVQYSGRMGRVHNLEPLIAAAHLLQDTPVLFQLIGEGAKRAKLESLTQELGLTNVQFLPYQPYETMAQVLSAADLGAVCLEKNCRGVSVPSKTYGLLACARPILALMEPESEIGQLVGETESGLVLTDATGETIAQTIRQLLATPATLEQMGANAYQTFQQNYRLDIALARYDLFLRQHFGVPMMQAVPLLPPPTLKQVTPHG